MRTREQQLLNAVQRPDAYEEVVLDEGEVPVVLSVWAGAPAEPVVLFLPGTMTHPLLYEELLDALNRDGLSVVGLHPQAHGKSPRVPRPLTYDALLRDTGRALTWMRSRFPRSPRVVMGSSQGGALALSAASREHDLAAVVAHNILDPTDPGSLAITRAPAWASRLHPLLRPLLQGAARVTPDLPVPYWAYLDMRRVCSGPAVAERFTTDPLGRRTYPLRLLAGMLAEDITRPVTCPVTVLASSGDPLFPLPYIQRAYARIRAPRKELLVVESDLHLVLVEAVEVVLPVLLPRLHALTTT